MELAGLVPAIGKALEVARAIRSTGDALFLRKVARFLREFSNLSVDERASFTQAFVSEDELERFGESLLLLLEHSDEVEKPSVIGRLFRAAAQDKITFENAARLSAIVNRGYLSDLRNLGDFRHETPGRDSDISISLRSLGLLNVTSEDVFDVENSKYRLSKYGMLLLELGFES
ncbi:hypothetical protein [Rhizobium sp. 18065]|uniref:hypothetical protein n=1 Tax=Rhizobium sp. 18065 TaxID=2681411 RepID=UPI00135C47B2|nr:hypothetical protein [Rhizobium sp. 18065]